MKASLRMLLLVAIAALAVAAHNKRPSPSQSTNIVAAPRPALPIRLHQQTTADDGTIPDPLSAHFGIGLFDKPIEFRPSTPAFTDIGEVAQVSQYDREGPEGQAVAGTVAKVPVVGEAIGVALKAQQLVGQVFQSILGSDNAAGVSPQQLAYINSQIAHGVSPGVALALAEGHPGTKRILINGEYVLIGGTGLGGPGLSSLRDAEAV